MSVVLQWERQQNEKRFSVKLESLSQIFGAGHLQKYPIDMHGYFLKEILNRPREMIYLWLSTPTR